MGFLLLQFSFLSELNLVWRAGGRGPARKCYGRKSDKFDRVIDRDAKVKRSGIVFVWAWPHTRKRLSHDCKRRPRQQQQQRCNIIATYTMPRGLWVSRCIKQKQNDSNLRFFLSFGNLYFEMMIKMIATVQFGSVLVVWLHDHRSQIAVVRLRDRQNKESLLKWVELDCYLTTAPQWHHDIANRNRRVFQQFRINSLLHPHVIKANKMWCVCVAASNWTFEWNLINQKYRKNCEHCSIDFEENQIKCCLFTVVRAFFPNW